jgi:predicted N-acetyltransferase YhbS
VPLAPPQQYTIRRLHPDDAIQVSQVIYRVYGYSYPNPDLYYADHIVHLNETGELVSVVAVDESGTVVGHYALERPGLGPVAEAGQAVVAPAHRGRKLMEQMHTYLESEGRRLGLAGIYVQPVTAHTFSQRVQEDFGIRPCGVSLGVWPALVFKQIAEEAHPERSTLMLYYKYLQPPAPAVVHVPAHHRPMLERIYACLGGPVEFQVGRAPRGYGKVSVSYLKTHRLATIHVQQIGVDTAAEIRRVRVDLVETAAVDAVLLELPLAQPGAAHLCEAAEGDGFFFAGLGPCFAPQGDVLRLQYLQVPVDCARLQILSPFGRELLAYVAAERERVGRGAAATP